MADIPFAPSAERNAAAILEVLEYEFRDASEILEIGSGTGQHAVRFATALAHASWQTSDLDDNLAGIRARIADAGNRNIGAPILIDVRATKVMPSSYDGVYSANTAHIMSMNAVQSMFHLVGIALRPAGEFCLYGPFRLAGRYNAASNEQFDASLRARNAEMGIRDLEDLDELAGQNGLQRKRTYAMPSNNMMVIWLKSAEQG